MACYWGAAESRVGPLCGSSPRATHYALQEATELPAAAGESKHACQVRFQCLTSSGRFGLCFLWKPIMLYVDSETCVLYERVGNVRNFESLKCFLVFV